MGESCKSTLYLSRQPADHQERLKIASLPLGIKQMSIWQRKTTSPKPVEISKFQLITEYKEKGKCGQVFFRSDFIRRELEQAIRKEVLSDYSKFTADTFKKGDISI